MWFMFVEISAIASVIIPFIAISFKVASSIGL